MHNDIIDTILHSIQPTVHDTIPSISSFDYTIEPSKNPYTITYEKGHLALSASSIGQLILAANDAKLALESGYIKSFTQMPFTQCNTRALGLSGTLLAPISSEIYVALPEWMHPHVMPKIDASQELHQLLQTVLACGFNAIVLGMPATMQKSRTLDKLIDLQALIDLVESYNMQLIIKPSVIKKNKDADSYFTALNKSLESCDTLQNMTLLWEGFAGQLHHIFTEKTRLEICKEEIALVQKFLHKNKTFFYFVRLEEGYSEWLPLLSSLIPKNTILGFVVEKNNAFIDVLQKNDPGLSHRFFPILDKLEHIDTVSGLSFNTTIVVADSDVTRFKQEKYLYWLLGHSLLKNTPLSLLERIYNQSMYAKLV